MFPAVMKSDNSHKLCTVPAPVSLYRRIAVSLFSSCRNCNKIICGVCNLLQRVSYYKRALFLQRSSMTIKVKASKFGLLNFVSEVGCWHCSCSKPEATLLINHKLFQYYKFDLFRITITLSVLVCSHQ